MDQVYPPLVNYWHRLNINEGDNVLVPLCGKSKDLLWLAERGVKVIGVEVSDLAVYQFFSEFDLPYSKRKTGDFTVFEAENIQLWQGDFFKLRATMLPPVKAIYDKAALVALPPDRRKLYAKLILQYFSPSCRMLVSTFEYPQDEMNGPPFAVFADELDQLYGQRCRMELLHEESILDTLSKFQRRGLHSYLREKVFLLEIK